MLPASPLQPESLNKLARNEALPPDPTIKPEIQRSSEQLIFFQHRTFGERAFSNYEPAGNTAADSLKRYEHQEAGLGSVQNTLTGIELAVKNGFVPEIDLVKTADGDYITGHPKTADVIAGKKATGESTADYLQTNPEALTVNELFEWLAHQEDPRSKLYVELKSEIEVGRLMEAATKAIATLPESVNKLTPEQLLSRVMLYTSNQETIKKLLQGKKELKMDTNTLPLTMLTDKLVTRDFIDKAAKLSEEYGTGVFAIEQGMFAWTQPFLKRVFEQFAHGFENQAILQSALDLLWKIKAKTATPGKPSESEQQKNMMNMADLVKHAGSKTLKLIIGTQNNPKMIRYLAECGVYGIVPDNAVDYEIAGIQRPVYEKKPTATQYIPESMRTRVQKIGSAVGTA